MLRMVLAICLAGMRMCFVPHKANLEWIWTGPVVRVHAKSALSNLALICNVKIMVKLVLAIT